MQNVILFRSQCVRICLENLGNWGFPFFADHPHVSHLRQIEKIQDQGMRELGEYCAQVHADQPYRQGKLLTRLPALRLLNPAVMEELFFAGLIGNVQIDSIIPYILRMESEDYSSQLVQMELDQSQGVTEEVPNDNSEAALPATTTSTPEIKKAIVITP